MKKAIVVIALIVMCCVLSFPAVASANSAIRESYGVSASGAIITTQNCPVQVSAERLTFNIKAFPQVYDISKDYNANVEAEYDFYNPEDYDVNMQLVFPFGRAPEYLGYDYNDVDKYGIFVGGTEVERTVRATYNYYDFDLSTDLPKISDTPVLLKGYSENSVVYKYSVSLNYSHVSNSEYYYAKYKVDNQILVVDSPYYASFNTKNGTREMSMRIGNSFVLYSVGEQLNDEFFNAKYYVEIKDKNNYKQEEISGKATYSCEEINLTDLLCTKYDAESGVSKTDYYNAVADYLSSCDYNADLSNLNLKHELLYWYQYNVTVPAKQIVTNKVVAPLYPDVNEYYEPPVYTYNYLLSPASSFAKFSDLSITVNTDYYILSGYTSFNGVNNSVSFTKTENGYSAHFNNLPKGELWFELCSSENPEYDNGMDGLWILLIALAIPFLFIFIVIIAVIAVAVRRKRKNRREMERVGNSQTISDEQREEAMKYFFDDIYKDDTDKK